MRRGVTHAHARDSSSTSEAGPHHAPHDCDGSTSTKNDAPLKRRDMAPGACRNAPRRQRPPSKRPGPRRPRGTDLGHGALTPRPLRILIPRTPSSSTAFLGHSEVSVCRSAGSAGGRPSCGRRLGSPHAARRRSGSDCGRPPRAAQDAPPEAPLEDSGVRSRAPRRSRRAPLEAARWRRRAAAPPLDALAAPLRFPPRRRPKLGSSSAVRGAVEGARAPLGLRDACGRAPRVARRPPPSRAC